MTDSASIRTLVIAAAGRGTRMRELATDRPKHLVSIAGKPFFHYVLQEAVEAGFERIIVVIGHHANVMRAFLEEWAGSASVQLEIVDQYAFSPEKYGTAVVVEAVESLVGAHPFVLQNGDSLYAPSVYEQVMYNDGRSRVLGRSHPEPQHYGVLETDEELFLVRIIEKPEHPSTNIINTGLYTFQPHIFEAVRAVPLSPRGEYEIIDAINALAAHKRVTVATMQGEWVDLGTPEHIPEVEAFLSTYYLL